MDPFEKNGFPYIGDPSRPACELDVKIPVDSVPVLGDEKRELEIGLVISAGGAADRISEAQIAFLEEDRALLPLICEKEVDYPLKYNVFRRAYRRIVVLVREDVLVIRVQEEKLVVEILTYRLEIARVVTVVLMADGYILGAG